MFMYIFMRNILEFYIHTERKRETERREKENDWYLKYELTKTNIFAIMFADLEDLQMNS